MNALDNIKLGTKLIGSFLIVALIVAVVTGMGYVNLRSVNAATIRLHDLIQPQRSKPK